ncbi:hypothetical protein [Agromyces sp. M3QZ16-3]|uniref:hypothetical protein n=1 Tax=Agromyces sp. M3QZ16-3 TaxID=3447585 RepID=UPI003F68CC08
MDDMLLRCSVPRTDRRPKRPLRLSIATSVAFMLAAIMAIVPSATASAGIQSSCPWNAPILYRFAIDDYRLQQEVDKIGVCGDYSDTFLVIQNTSSQPIRFWSSTPGSTYEPVPVNTSPLIEVRNRFMRESLADMGSTGSYVLAGEAMRVSGRAADFTWDFDTALSLSVLAVDVAGSMAFNKLKRWATSGSKTRAAVATCALAATEAGATATTMDEVMSKLILGATPCAAAVESAGTAVEADTLLRRANTLQSRINSVNSLVKRFDLGDLLGRIIRRGH